MKNGPYFYTVISQDGDVHHFVDQRFPGAIAVALKGTKKAIIFCCEIRIEQYADFKDQLPCVET